jgi:hypothetical protein
MGSLMYCRIKNKTLNHGIQEKRVLPSELPLVLVIIFVLLIGTFKISVTVSSLKIPDIGVLSGGPPRLGGPQVGVGQRYRRLQTSKALIRQAQLTDPAGFSGCEYTNCNSGNQR